MTTRVFVYGSLLAGEPNHRHMGRARLLGIARTAPLYALVDTGPYPALIDAAQVGVAPGAIVGELYEVTDAELAALDAFEGHPHWYRRGSIALDDASTAEAYFAGPAIAEGHPVIPCGCWRTHRRGPPKPSM